jgi:hypothetical protein
LDASVERGAPYPLFAYTSAHYYFCGQVVLNESYPELGNPSILPGQRVPLSASNLPIKSIPGGGRKKLHRFQAAEQQKDGPDGVVSKTNDTVDSGGKHTVLCRVW